MADETETPEGAAGPGPDQQPLIINAQYIRDLSFEVPSAPGIFQLMQQSQPDIQLNIKVDSNKFEDPGNVFEVILLMEATAKVGDDIGFILELEYAGLFTLNVPEEHLQPMIFIECPRLLFPFARNILAEVTRDGGFPPLMLGPVDFVAMFQQEILNQEGAAGADAEAGS